MLDNVKAKKMSALTAHASPLNFLHSVQDALSNLFHRPARAADPLEALRALPDHVLLDIGIDPRTVDCGPVSLIGGFDTVSGRHLATLTRTTAKS